MDLISVVSSDKRVIIGSYDGCNITTYSFDGNSLCFMSSWTTDGDVYDILVVSKSSHTEFVLIAATRNSFILTNLNVVGEAVGHSIHPHNLKDTNSLKLGYIPRFETVVVPRFEGASVIIPIECVESEIDLREASLKFDATKIFAAVTGFDLSLLHVVTVSALQANIALLSQSNKTGCVVLHWCLVECSSNSILPQWEAYLPCTYSGHTAIPSRDMLFVAAGCDVILCDGQGIVRTLAISGGPCQPLAGIAMVTSPDSSRANMITSHLNGVYAMHTIQFVDGMRDVRLQSSQFLWARAGVGSLCTCGSCPSTYSSFLPYFHNMHIISRDVGVVGLAVHDTFGHDFLSLFESGQPIDSVPVEKSAHQPALVSHTTCFGGPRSISHVAVMKRKSGLFSDGILICATDTVSNPTSLVMRCDLGLSLAAITSIPLDISDAIRGYIGGLPSVEFHVVICDTAVDAIPVTQRSHSSPWCSLVIMSSQALQESSLFTINHAGKIGLSMSSFDLITQEPTLAFFGVGEGYAVQIVPNCVTVLDVKTLRVSSRLDCSSLRLLCGQLVEKCAQCSHYSAHARVDRQMQRADHHFAISSRGVIKIICCENSSTGRALREIASKQLQNDIAALALCTLVPDEEFIVCASCWDTDGVVVLRIKRAADISQKSFSCIVVHTCSMGDLYPLRCNTAAITPMIIHMLQLSLSSDSTGHVLDMAVGSIDGRLVMGRLRIDSPSSDLGEWNMADIDVVSGGILKFVSQPMSKMHAGSVLVNGGDGDFLYVPGESGSIKDWLRYKLSRPTHVHKRSCMSLIHSYTAATCPLNSVFNHASSQEYQPPPPGDEHQRNHLAPLHTLKFIWLESLVQSDLYESYQLSDEGALSLCAGSVSSLDKVSSTHIQSRCTFPYRILELQLLNENKLVLLLWTQSPISSPYISGNPTSCVQPSQCGVSLLDALSLDLLWERRGDDVWGHPMAITPCPVPHIEIDHYQRWSSAFTVVMSNASALCFAVGGITGPVESLKILGAEQLLCGDASSMATYGWVTRDSKKSLEVSFREQSCMEYMTKLPTACVDIASECVDARNALYLVCVSLAYVGVEVWTWSVSGNKWQALYSVSEVDKVLDSLVLFVQSREGGEGKAEENSELPAPSQIVCIDRVSQSVILFRRKDTSSVLELRGKQEYDSSYNVIDIIGISRDDASCQLINQGGYVVSAVFECMDNMK